MNHKFPLTALFCFNKLKNDLASEEPCLHKLFRALSFSSEAQRTHSRLCPIISLFYTRRARGYLPAELLGLFYFRPQTSSFFPLPSSILHLTSDISLLTSYFRPQPSDFSLLTSAIKHHTSSIRLLTSAIILEREAWTNLIFRRRLTGTIYTAVIKVHVPNSLCIIF